LAYYARPYLVRRKIDNTSFSYSLGDSVNRPFCWRNPLDISTVTLEGNRVRLVPLSMNHLDQLCNAGLIEDLWRFNPAFVRDRNDMRIYMQTALKLRDDGIALPFVTIEKSNNMLVGSTRYLNIDRFNRRLEIGSTWITPEWQKTHVNTEAKYLMLKHAFETLGCIRVEFKTDSLNEKSRKALSRIGAKEEGTLRNHIMMMPDGRMRHSVYYSIIDSEWRGVKANLEKRMAQNSGSAVIG
jgi:N-acetyltransferase